MTTAIATFGIIALFGLILAALDVIASRRRAQRTKRG